MRDAEGRTPLHLATDPAIRRLVQGEEMLRISSDKFDLLEAVEVNDTTVREGRMRKAGSVSRRLATMYYTASSSRH